MHKVGRAKLAQGDERLGACINCFMEDLLGKPRRTRVSSRELGKNTAGRTDSGTAGATIATDQGSYPGSARCYVAGSARIGEESG
jgi:hypothetical protein